MGFNISQQIDVRRRCANIDALYGPYNSLSEALTAVPVVRRAVGRTVGIITPAGIVEYWWKVNTDDESLIQKNEQLSLSLQSVGETSFTKNEGEPIYAQFLVDGGATIKRAVLYQVIDGVEVFVQEYTNVGKRSPYTFTIPNPEVSGVYHYRVRVIDGLDSYATVTEEVNYLEYTLYYGGISTVYNLTELNTVLVKNFTSVAEIPFQLNIAVRDDTFEIISVELTDSTDESSEDLSVELTRSGTNYLGSNTYYMPSAAVLEDFDGKKLSVVVTYSENGTVRKSTTELFRLLAISSLEIIPEYEGGNFYTSLPAYYTFVLQAGVENLSILLTPGETSDFDFERTTVVAYRRFSLRVIPKGISKDNAQIVINYFFTYNNTEYTGTFTRTIGNILNLPAQSFYEPSTSGTVTRETIVYADSEDNTGIDNGAYYKIISESKQFGCPASSFILDAYCKINQQNDKNIKYIQITYGGVEVASVTEDEISCAMQWNSLYTDTPVNEWAQIGIGVNLRESVRRGENEETGHYHGIYVNGMLVKTVLIDNVSIRPLTYDSNKRLVITIGEGILVQKCFLYYNNNGSDMISPNTAINGAVTDTSIVYNNYKSHDVNFEEPGDLPVLKFLRITDKSEMEYYFGLINQYKDAHDEDKIVHLTTFGTIGSTKAQSINEYDSNYASSEIESDATLFRQSVNIKKPAQKEYAVLCRAMWKGSEIQDVIVEVHTQGTSTLVYSVPNFKFTFWRISSGTVQRYEPQFIEKEEGSGQYYKESIYTAKADFMDSSHLNNTPTCNYYNNLIQKLITEGTIAGSPSARNGMIDAIMGFPIVMEISDNATNFDDIFINIGSFMLNVDKTGNSLGFEVTEDGNKLSCISFEGTSNDNNSGASGRFDIPEGVDLKDYTNGTNVVDEDAIRADYAIANSAKGKNLDDTVDGVLVRNLPYVKWCSFLSDGLEYRYPDSDIYKLKDENVLNKVMNVEHFIALYKMWWWVYKSDQLNTASYKEQFVQHFDLHYCIIYFIQLMIYAQTDNLGKNAMFDSWNGQLWYPRPYDLDSEAGLDNNGNDNVASFVEIRPAFSLDYDINKADNFKWLSDNYLLDEPVTTVYYHKVGEVYEQLKLVELTDEIRNSATEVSEIPSSAGTEDVEYIKMTSVTSLEGDIIYPKTTIEYGNQTYDRYHFSSNKSKLWITFYKNFKTEIESFYSDLRRNMGYTPESIIELCKTSLIDTLGIAQYNKDFQNKYLANSDQRLAYGNRWYKFKKWITNRFAFCDSYFGAVETASYNVNSVINYNINVDAPQYVAQQYQTDIDTRFVLDRVSFSAGSGAATIITLRANQPSVFETTLFKGVTYNNGGRNYKNLISLDVSGNNNSAFTSIESVTGSSLENLKYLNISNSAVQNLEVPVNLKTLLAENVKLNTVTIAENCVVEEISLVGSTIQGNVDFSQLPNLKKLDLTDCTFNGTVTFAQLPQLEELVMTRTVFNNSVVISAGVRVTTFNFAELTLNSVSFSGTDLEIDTVNFYNTKFGVDTVNINAIRKNIKNLYFDGCTGLTHLQITDGGKFEKLECLSLANSYIKSLGASSENFDCTHFNNMSNLKKVSAYNANGTVSYTNFTFQNTKVEKIINLSWNGTGYYLFADCRALKSIGGTITFKTSLYATFYRCYLLETLPNITVDNSVTDARYVFAGANALSYANVANIISQCTKCGDFRNAFQCKKFVNNQEINLNSLFASNTASAINIAGMFTQYNANSTYTSITNRIVLTGKFSTNVTIANNAFYGFSTISVPYDLLSNATGLISAIGLFASSSVTFTGNGRPSIEDSHGQTVTPSNLVDKTFFSSNLTDISGMFHNTNVATTDVTIFANLSKLEKTNATFGRTSEGRFTFVNSQNETETILYNAATLWMNNPNITDISGCFANNYSVYCTGLSFNANVPATRTINISGLFGLRGTTNRSVAPITINLDAIVPRLTTTYSYSIPYQSTYNSVGVFQNRNVSISTTATNGKVFTKLTSNCVNMFYGANLYLPSSVTEFDLSNAGGDCSSMFRACRLYTQGEEGHSYTIADRKFVNVTLPTRGSIYYYMFGDSSVLASLPTLNSGANNLNYMYRGCVINTPDLELPANYFEPCRNVLSNVSGMFYNNTYLTTLQYSATRGLFEGCTNLSNVTEMFYGARFLHKGIPVNFFGSTQLPRITSLANMFAYTSVLFDVENGSNKWINAGTLEPLVNLDNISGLFAYGKINSSYIDSAISGSYKSTMTQSVENDAGINVAPIDPNTFTGKTYTNISRLFKHTVINPPTSIGTFRFLGFTNGNEAFFSSSVANINQEFVDSSYISSILRADRMFYQSNTGGRYNNTINSLATFVKELIKYPNTSKANIAGNVNINDDSIPSTYTAYTTSANSDLFYGNQLMLQSAESAENSYPGDSGWVGYGRYNYT